MDHYAVYLKLLECSMSIIPHKKRMLDFQVRFSSVIKFYTGKNVGGKWKLTFSETLMQCLHIVYQ